MIKTKTLLIVGAGASVPYGYPTGYDLMNKLYNSDNLHDLQNTIDKIGLELFCKHFKESQLNSIDAFLAKRGDDIMGKQASGAHHTYGACGKLAIANQLIECENYEQLLYEPNSDHWLKYLWNLMSDVPKTEFQNNQVKIVSFNYDRVIEQYLQTTIENTYTDGTNTKEATELRKSIKIVHMYGNLQDLENRAYGKKPYNIEMVANCIRVIPEAREDDEVFEEAKKMISWADKICFLGFSFDLTNMQRLGFPNHNLSGKTIYSTHFGKTELEAYADRKLLVPKGVDDKDTDITSGSGSTAHKTLDCIRSIGFFSHPCKLSL